MRRVRDNIGGYLIAGGVYLAAFGLWLCTPATADKWMATIIAGIVDGMSDDFNRADRYKEEF